MPRGQGILVAAAPGAALQAGEDWMSDLTTGDGAEARLRRLAELLGRFARLMEEQAAFHASERMVFSVSVVRSAAAQAQRRMGRVRDAGARWLYEMEKSLLADLARAAHAASAVAGEAGDEAWPDLAAAAAEARGVIREAAERDASLFSPQGFNPEAVANAPSAPFDDPSGWRAVDEDCFVAVGTLGVPMAAVAWGPQGGRRWLAQVGGIGMGFHDTPSLAAKAAGLAHGDWFGRQA